MSAELSKQILAKCPPEVTYTCDARLVLCTLKACRAASPWPDSISSLAFLPIMVAPSSSSGSNLAKTSSSSAPFMASSSACNPSASSTSFWLVQSKREQRRERRGGGGVLAQEAQRKHKAGDSVSGRLLDSSAVFANSLTKSCTDKTAALMWFRKLYFRTLVSFCAS